MKKLIAFTLSVLLLLPMLTGAVLSAWAPTYGKLSPIQRDSDVLARIVIGSDVHIGDVAATPKFENAYKVIGQLGGADAFIIAGDLTNGGKPEQFDELMRIVKANSKTITVDIDGFSDEGTVGAPVGTTILAMGNHEFYAKSKGAPALFTEKTGQATDKLYWIADKVPVIKLSMASATYRDAFATKHEFIKESLAEIERKGYTGHIFLISHIAPYDTVIGSVDRPFAAETMELLKKYPQIIHVSGHSHQVINSPLFIDQSAGYTVMTDGVVGEDYDDTDPENLGSNMIVFDVKSNGTTEFHRVDLENGELLYDHENWTLDASDTAEDFVYFTNPSNTANKNAYHLKSAGATFPSDAWVKVEDLGDADSVKVTFTPNAVPPTNNNHDYINSYVVKATAPDGDGVTVSASVVSDEYKPVSLRAETRSVTLRGLDWNVDYEITVQAVTSYGVSGEKIVAEGYTNVGNATPAKLKMLYDIDYSYGNTADAFGHESKMSPVSKLEYAEDIDQNVMTFNGNWTNTYAISFEDVNMFRNEFSMETYFNLKNLDGDQTIISMIDYCGAEILVEEEKIKFNIKTSNSNYLADAPINANEWVHVAVTYNSKVICLYVNGVLVDTARHSGGLTSEIIESNGDKSGVIHLGGRNSGTYLLSKGSQINSFRLYRGAMTDEEVKNAYEKTVKPNVTLPFADVAEDAWYADTVRYAYENRLMNGTSDTAFSPSVATSRAMIVQLLYNMEGRPAVEYKPVFTDVSEDAWYADAVIWAYENGVTTGSSATTFSPHALVTREQVAVFLYRFMKDYKDEEMAEGADISAFPDSGKISPYAGFAEAVAWANGVGIITGKTSSDGAILAPLDNAQRCETATMFARFHRGFVA